MATIQFKSVLQDLKRNPSPHIPNPPFCNKRASVALIIRIRPPIQQNWYYDPSRYSTSTKDFDECIEGFFDQAWVRDGDLEALFIKRAARAGDRWTSHVALPGGRRDPDDVDDMAASVRETWEETGLELNTDYCLKVGHLPERVVTTAWGKKPLMVLCPYVFLLLRFDTPPLNLQPTEVQSAHWVSLQSLLSPSLRTFEQADIFERTLRLKSPFLRRPLRLCTGQMMFSAVRLQPSESLICNVNQGIAAAGQKVAASNGLLFKRVLSLLATGESSANNHEFLLLWGLTLGVVADFLEIFNPDATAKLWSWPTFSHWDAKIWLWVLTRSFRVQRLQETQAIKQRHRLGGAAEDVARIDNTTYSSTTISHKKCLETGIAGAHLLDGYFEKMRTALILALCVRLSTGVLVLGVFLQKWRQR